MQIPFKLKFYDILSALIHIQRVAIEVEFPTEKNHSTEIGLKKIPGQKKKLMKILDSQQRQKKIIPEVVLFFKITSESSPGKSSFPCNAENCKADDLFPKWP